MPKRRRGAATAGSRALKQRKSYNKRIVTPQSTNSPSSNRSNEADTSGNCGLENRQRSIGHTSKSTDRASTSSGKAERNSSTRASTNEFVKMHGGISGIRAIATAACELSGNQKRYRSVKSVPQEDSPTEKTRRRKQTYNRNRYQNASLATRQQWIIRSALRVKNKYGDEYRARYRTAYRKKTALNRRIYIQANCTRMKSKYRSLSPTSKALYIANSGHRVDRTAQKVITSRCYRKLPLSVRSHRRRVKYHKSKIHSGVAKTSQFVYPSARNVPEWVKLKFSSLPDNLLMVERINAHKSSDEWLHFFWSAVHRLESSWAKRNGFATLLSKRQRLTVATNRVHSFIRHMNDAFKQILSDANKLRTLYLSAEAFVSHETDMSGKENLLREIYGGKRYHVRSCEDVSFDTKTARYYPLARFDFKSQLNPSLVQLPGTAGLDDDLETDTSGIGSETTHVYRLCDASCSIPENWALRVHEALSSLKPGSILQCIKFFQKFESCIRCKQKQCPGPNSCTDFITVLLRIRPHFSGVRTVLRRIYLLRQKLGFVAEADKALLDGLWEKFSEIYKKFIPSKQDVVCNQKKLSSQDAELLHVGRIIEQYGDLFDLFDARFDDHPTNPCDVCRRLFSKRDLKSLNVDAVFNKPGALFMWENVKLELVKRNICFPIKICANCRGAISDGMIPRFSMLNGMDVSDNSMFKNMNVMEKTLIKLVKMFHEVYKLKNVSGGNWGKQPIGIKGLGFHLPLPSATISETLNRYKMPNLDHLTILIECQPTKKKTLYRYKADLTRNVLPVLELLKKENWLYKDIEILSEVDFEKVIAEVGEEEVDDDVLPTERTNARSQWDATGSFAEREINTVSNTLPVSETATSILPVDANPDGMDINNGACASRDTPGLNAVRDSDAVGQITNQPIVTGDANRTSNCDQHMVTGVNGDISNLRMETTVEEPSESNVSLLTMMSASEILPGHSVCRIDYEAPNESSVDMYKMGRVCATPLFESEKHLDVKCFVHLYKDGKFGFDWPRHRKLSYSEFIKARMNHEDPRFRRDTEYVFHGAQYKDMSSLRSGVYTTLKVGKFQGLTAGHLRNKMQVEEPELMRNLYSLLSTVPGTKEYNFQRFSDFCAMDEKFDDAIWFFTASCNEHGWSDCMEFVKSRNYDLAHLPDADILLKDQGSICVFFHRRWLALREDIICQTKGPLGDVEHWGYRIEFQARGPPHVHAKFWVKGAPRVGVDSDETVLEWVKSKISCHIPPEPGRLRDAVLKFQTHKCNRSCRQKKFCKNKFYTCCRYGFPRSVLSKGRINSSEEIARSRAPSRLPKRLIDLPRLSGEEYINNYCPAILLKWWGNMDISYCATRGANINYYISIYMSKAEKTLLRSAFDQLFESSNKSIISQLYSLGRAQFKNRERGQHEAFDRCNGVKLFETSVPVKFFSTALRSDKKRRLKPVKELEGLTDDSTDIYCVNFVEDYYPKRPKTDEFENMCLQDFCSDYEVVKEAGKRKSTNDREFEMMNNIGYARRRVVSVVFKTNNYKSLVTADQRERYFHSLLMRFIPYRNEDELLEGYRTYEESFNAKRDRFERMATADYRVRLLRRALDLSKELQQVATEEDHSADNDMGHAGQLTPHDSIPLAPVTADQLRDLIGSLNSEQRHAFEKVQNALMHQQNHDDHSCTCSSLSQCLLFVSGVGGTGKSHVIKAMTKWTQAQFGGKDGCEKVAAFVGAPTGMAAINVSGLTLHRLLKLPVQKGNRFIDYKQLNSDELKILRAMFKDTRLLIVDEVSMVANVMLYFIDARLREIFAKPDELFGGMNVVLLGDLLQLRPVNNQFVFENVATSAIRNIFGCVHAFTLWNHFEYIELTTNMRQKDDPAWASLLARARVGELSVVDEELLNERLLTVGPEETIGIRQNFGPFAPECSLEQAAKFFVDVLQKDCPSVVSLFSQNETCSQFNDFCLQHKGIDPISIRCFDVGGRRVNGKRKKREFVKASDAGGLEEELKIGVGARVMLRRNICQEKGLVNGALGYVQRINWQTGRHGKEFVASVDVRFDDHDLVERITKTSAEFNSAEYHGRTRHQFPLCLAYAMTIHKCQGLTLESALIDLGDSCFEEGMGYVALSRCRRLQNVYLFRFNHRHIWCDGKSIAEYNRLRTTFMPELPAIRRYNSRGTGRKRKTLVRSLALEGQVEEKRRRLESTDACHTEASHRGTKDAQIPFLTFRSHLNSCFADSSLHALFSMNGVFSDYTIRQSNHFDEEVCRLYRRWRTSATETSMNIRQAVAERFGNLFSSGEQCDAVEFTANLLQLLNPAVSNLFTLTQRTFVSCCHCDMVTELAPRTCDFILPPFEDGVGRITFNEFMQGKQIVNRTCSSCGCQQPHQSWYDYVFPPSNRYVLVNVPKFGLQQMITAKITGLAPNGQLIAGERFKLIAAVQHRGTSFQTGHYVTWIRGGKSNNEWVLECLQKNKWTSFDGLGALIISPTRELAYQTYQVLVKIGKRHDFSAALIIGGTEVGFERGRLARMNIIICTPGRLLQHMDENPDFVCDNLRILVLDEADRILDLGFREQLISVVQNLPKDRQTLLFSATQTKSVKALGHLSLKNPKYISVHKAAEFSTPDSLIQSYVICNDEDKINFLWSFLKNHTKSKLLIFMATCKQVRYVYSAFKKLRPGLTVMCLHGGMPQSKRVRVYDEYCRKEKVALMATDIAARGLDFPAIDMVLQLDCPQDANEYIHRSGRTARYRSKGESILALTEAQGPCMTKLLASRRVPLDKIEVNSKRMLDMTKKLQTLCAQDQELKAFAQRAFVAYLRYLYMAKNKELFSVDAVNKELLAKSYGLPASPRVRFLQAKKAKALPNRRAAADATMTKPAKPDVVMDESTMIDVNEAEADDFLTVKKEEVDIDDVVPADADPCVPSTSKTSSKPMTKAQIVKKMLRKNTMVNQKIVFDDEGQPVQPTTPADTNEQRSRGHAVYDIEAAAERLKTEDKVDIARHRERVKQRHREKRLKKKEAEALKRGTKRKQPENEDDFEVTVGDGGVNSSENESEPEQDPYVSNTKEHDEFKAFDRKRPDISGVKRRKKTKRTTENLSLDDAEAIASKLLSNS